MRSSYRRSLKYCEKDVGGGAKDSYIAGDLTVELGMMCTNEKDIEELNVTYEPLRWQGYDKDPGGIRKLMWYGIIYDGVQLQGHIYMVKVWKGKRNGLHAQKNWDKRSKK